MRIFGIHIMLLFLLSHYGLFSFHGFESENSFGSVKEPDSVAEWVDIFFLQIKGPPPHWEPTVAETELRNILGTARFDQLLSDIGQLKIWVDPESAEKLDTYLALLRPHRNQPGIRDVFVSLANIKAAALEELKMSPVVPASADKPASRIPSQAIPTDTPSLSSDALHPMSVTLRVVSNRGNPIENASASIKGTGGLTRTTVTDQIYHFAHTSNGDYVYNGPISTDYSGLELSVSAPRYSPVQQDIFRVSSRQTVELIYNDYIEHCNNPQIRRSGWWGTDPWEGCRVDPVRLVETFGLVVHTLPNTDPTGKVKPLEDVSLVRYLPGADKYIFDFSRRKETYATVLEQLAMGFALSKAMVYSSVMTDAITPDFQQGKTATLEDIHFHSIALGIDLLDKASTLSALLSGVGYSLELYRIHQENQLSAFFAFIGYQASLGRFIEMIDERSGNSWIAQDLAFMEAMTDVRASLEEIEQKGYEEFADALAARRVNEKLDEIILNIIFKTALSEVGTNFLSLVTAKKAVLLAGGIKTALVYTAYDFAVSVGRTRDAESMLFILSQMDRQFFEPYPDNLDAVQTRRYSTNAFEFSLIRLQLGMMFNDARAHLLSGGTRTWIGRSWQYVTPDVRTESQAFDAAMVQRSHQKMETAERDLARVIEILVSRLHPQTGETHSPVATRIADMPVLLNTWYRTGERGGQYIFFERDGALLSQQNEGDVHLAYAYGLITLSQVQTEKNMFLANWASGHGGNTESYVFGTDAEGRFYADITCDVCDYPVRFFAYRNRKATVCSMDDAAQIAASHFSPACPDDPSAYKPVEVLDLNRVGRKAYIFPSCAGPQTRGNVTYLIIEKKVGCKILGSVTTDDPYAQFSVTYPRPERYGRQDYERPTPAPMIILASGVRTEYQFDIQRQRYQHSRVLAPEQGTRRTDEVTPPDRSGGCPESVTDSDGNRYPVIRVGDHCWMARNLETSRYRNGDRIPNVSNSVEWSRLESGAWTYYDNNRSHGESFGKLYNGYAARDRRSVCPDGWSVPEDRHWNAVNQGLRGEPPLRNQAMEFLESLKKQPGGGRFFTGSHGQRSLTPAFGSQTNSQFNNGGRLGMWWGSLDRGNRLGSTFNARPDGQGIIPDANHIAGGFSIRCVMPAQ